MNPQPIESRDIANNAGYEDDPVLASEGVVIPRVAVVSTPSGSSANKTQIVDSAGNPISSLLAPSASSNGLYVELLGPGGFPVNTTRTPSASPVALITGSYPILLASWVSTTASATLQSATLDVRPFQSIVGQVVVTAISGSLASLTLLLEYQEPTTNTWWSPFGIATITSVSASRADGSFIPTTATLGVPSATGGRSGWPNTRITILIAGAATSVTFSAYVWGF